MKYFTIDEMCKSSTAEAKKIDNTPTEEVVENLTALIDTVLDPLREAWGEPIIVNSGYRCKELNTAVGGSKTSQHCFDADTELLTMAGWKKYNDIEVGELIFSYSIKKGEIEVVPIDEIIKYPYKGKMVLMESKHLNLCVTDGHRMLVRYDSHKYVRHDTRNITSEGQKYFDSLKTDNDKYHIELAKDVFGKRRFYLSAGKFNGTLQCDLSIDFIKLMLAVVADGCLTRKNGKLSGIIFSFKKERKIQHVEALLNRMGIHYTVRIRNWDGATVIWCNSKIAKPIFELIGKEKNLPSWLIRLSADIQKELVHEYSFYDGCSDKRGHNSLLISSINKANVDLLQTMCILSGMRCAVKEHIGTNYTIREKSGKAKNFYTLHINTEKCENKLKEDSYKWIDYDGVVWCVSNRNSTVIVRRNGKVSIQGNCKGQAADIVPTRKTKERVKELFQLIKKLGLHYDQLINESDYSWVHISYKKDGNNRSQILYL